MPLDTGRLAATLAALPLIAVTALSTSPPASAGGVSACTKEFRPVASAPLVSASGVTLGRMKLLAEPGTKEFCGRFRVARSAQAAGSKVLLELGVASASQDSGLAHNQVPATHVHPIVIDAHGYPAGSTVTFRVTFKAAERVTGELTGTVTSHHA